MNSRTTEVYFLTTLQRHEPYELAMKTFTTSVRRLCERRVLTVTSYTMRILLLDMKYELLRDNYYLS